MAPMAGEVMRRDLICVPEHMDLRDLTRLFLEKGITGAPVVDSDGELQGVVSQTDLLYYSLTRDDQLKMDTDFYHSVRVEGRHLPRGFQIEDVNTGTVGDIMTPLVYSVTERSSIESVARMMTRMHIHRVIVRRGRKAVGIISALDILRRLARKSNSKRAAKKTPQRGKTDRRARGSVARR